MFIKKLTSENLKRLTVVDITPNGNLITIGGKNGAGKSSVLDSIAYALGGGALVPSEPIRTGEREAKITVDLGDFIVTRRFYRDQHSCNCKSPAEAELLGFSYEHDADCKSRTFGPTKSVLTVTTPEGAKFPSPQALLDSLYGKLTFDPLAFSREPAKKQNEILRQLVNLDFTILDKNIAEVMSERRHARSAATSAASYVASLPRHDIEVTEEIPLSALQEEFAAVNAAKEKVHNADKLVALRKQELSEATRKRDEVQAEMDTVEETIRQLQLRLSALQAKHTEWSGVMALYITNVNDAKLILERCGSEVPDTSALESRMREITETNRKVRENKTHKAAELDSLLKEAEMTRLENRVTELNEMRRLALLNAAFPVPGLGLTEDGVTYEGLPLEQVSSSVQLRVSVAIGLALNPRLKVLLIRNGNLLDEDGLKAIAEQAKAADAQVWMEYVASNKDGVSVMLEDGHLA